MPQRNGGNNETYFPESLQGLSEIILCEPPRTALATLISTQKIKSAIIIIITPNLLKSQRTVMFIQLFPFYTDIL